MLERGDVGQGRKALSKRSVPANQDEAARAAVDEPMKQLDAGRRPRQSRFRQNPWARDKRSSQRLRRPIRPLSWNEQVGQRSKPRQPGRRASRAATVRVVKTSHDRGAGSLGASGAHSTSWTSAAWPTACSIATEVLTRFTPSSAAIRTPVSEWARMSAEIDVSLREAIRTVSSTARHRRGVQPEAINAQGQEDAVGPTGHAHQLQARIQQRRVQHGRRFGLVWKDGVGRGNRQWVALISRWKAGPNAIPLAVMRS